MTANLYFDANGSTPVDERVLELFLRTLRELPGNASAAHPSGLAAKAAIEKAREEAARALGAKAQEIVFTSGGTESNNWALSAVGRDFRSGHVLVSAIEHKSVLLSALALRSLGFEVELLSPREDGALRVEDVARHLRPDTRLVALMLANNETGVVQPVAQLAELCRARGVRLHVDAVAALGKLAVDVRQLGCDSLALSAHKMYAPKGTGLLFVRADCPLSPATLGCGQQGGQRSGTENTAGAVAFGFALALQQAGQLADARRLGALRDQLWAGLCQRFPRCQRNGQGEILSNTLSVYFPGRSALHLQRALAARGISVALGASASSGEPSHVLRAMGLALERARGSLRFSLCTHHVASDIEELLYHLGATYHQAQTTEAGAEWAKSSTN